MSLGQDWVNGRVGHGGQAVFWSKINEPLAQCGQVCSQITHHEMGKRVESSKKKKFTYTDTDGFLEHSPNGKSSTTRGPPSRI